MITEKMIIDAHFHTMVNVSCIADNLSPYQNIAELCDTKEQIEDDIDRYVAGFNVLKDYELFVGDPAPLGFYDHTVDSNEVIKNAKVVTWLDYHYETGTKQQPATLISRDVWYLVNDFMIPLQWITSYVNNGFNVKRFRERPYLCCYC